MRSVIGISDFGVLIWGSSSPGHLFPWPSPSGPEPALTESTDLPDYILYVYFLKTGLLFVLIGFFWMLNVLIFYKWFYKKRRSFLATSS
jgi:hypothetical protein